jgi:hypothetical protein
MLQAVKRLFDYAVACSVSKNVLNKLEHPFAWEREQNEKSATL